MEFKIVYTRLKRYNKHTPSTKSKMLSENLRIVENIIENIEKVASLVKLRTRQNVRGF